MRIWKSLARKYPLNHERDVWAHIGLRFVWSSLPLLLLAIPISIGIILGHYCGPSV